MAIDRVMEYALKKDAKFRKTHSKVNEKNGWKFNREIFVVHSDSSMFTIQNAQAEKYVDKKTKIKFIIIFSEHHFPVVLCEEDIFKLKTSKPSERPRFVQYWNTERRREIKKEGKSK